MLRWKLQTFISPTTIQLLQMNFISSWF
jgi:hypothetical protein